MREILQEVTRDQLLTKSKNGSNYSINNQAKGRNRYERRVYQKVSKSTATYDVIDMNNLFKQDILSFNIEVKGETNTYNVKLKLAGVLKEIADCIKRNKDVLEFKCVREGVMRVFLYGDVYMKCDCPDFTYNFKHWSYVNGYASGKPGDDPGPGKGIANPLDKKGAGCKHTMSVLANKEWVVNVSRTINNYINYMRENREVQFQRLIYPKLFGKQYKDPNKDYKFKPLVVPKSKQSLRKFNQLKTDKGTIDTANTYGKTRGQFKKGNQSGIRFTKNDANAEDQVAIDQEDEAS